MDWPEVNNPFLGPEEEDFFHYVEEYAGLASRALICHDNRRVDKLTLHAGDEESWGKWRYILIRWELSKYGKLPDSQESGYHVLLSARTKPVQVEPRIEALNSLPIPREDWRLVTSQFHLHKAVCEPMLDIHPSLYAVSLVKDHDQDTLDMSTAVMPSDYEDFIAISSTYFRSTKVTRAVIYGCNKDQMAHVERLLENSPEVSSLPLLMIGVFEELHRRRLEKLHRAAGDEYFDLILDHRLDQLQHLNKSLRQFRTRTRNLEEETTGAKHELEKMIERVKELKAEKHQTTLVP